MVQSWLILIVCLVLAVAFTLEGLRRRLESRLNDLERRLDAIAGHLGMRSPADDYPEVVGLLRAGRKIEAIKVYREKTGAGLARAKEEVERLERLQAGPKVITA
jgi:hypothetical protein